MKKISIIVTGLLAAAALIVLSGADSIECTPAEPSEPVCVVASDCEGLPHVLCLGNWTCQAGNCVWKCGTTDPPPLCLTNEECGKGFSCINGKCVQDGPVDPPPPPACASDYDCPKGFFCLDGLCVKDEPVDPPPPPVCFKHDDCKPGLVCVDGLCVSTGCYGDQDCPAGTACNAGEVCLPPPGCVPGSPCPAVCYGYCVPDKPVDNGCVVSGCSGEICAAEPMASICIWADWYACFKLSECGTYGAGGKCAWKETQEFLACMAQYGK